jgi:hypothetical protein
MKKLITTTLIIIFLVSTGMSQVFDGINLKEDTELLKSKLKDKGFVFNYGLGSSLKFTGDYDDKSTTVYSVSTIKSNKTIVLSAFVGDAQSWDELLSTYRKYVKMFSDKYGNPDVYFESFKPPYDKNFIGKELQAVKEDKANFLSEWTRDGITYAVEIFQYKSVIIRYKSEENYELNKMELK